MVVVVMIRIVVVIVVVVQVKEVVVMCKGDETRKGNSESEGNVKKGQK